MTAKRHGFVLNCVGGYPTLNILKSTELYIFKQVNFTVCELYLNKTATKKRKLSSKATCPSSNNDIRCRFLLHKNVSFLILIKHDKKKTMGD